MAIEHRYFKVDTFFAGKSCTHNGVQYRNGASFPDDCNTCTCTDGLTSCTKMACRKRIIIVNFTAMKSVNDIVGTIITF